METVKQRQMRKRHEYFKEEFSRRKAKVKTSQEPELRRKIRQEARKKFKLRGSKKTIKTKNGKKSFITRKR